MAIAHSHPSMSMDEGRMTSPGGSQLVRVSDGYLVVDIAPLAATAKLETIQSKYLGGIRNRAPPATRGCPKRMHGTLTDSRFKEKIVNIVFEVS